MTDAQGFLPSSLKFDASSSERHESELLDNLPMDTAPTAVMLLFSSSFPVAFFFFKPNINAELETRWVGNNDIGS